MFSRRAPVRPEFYLDVVVRDRTARVTPHGDLDTAVADNLRDRLDDLVSLGVDSIDIDLAHVTFVDSTALGVIVHARRMAAMAGGALRLHSVSDHLRTILDLTGLASLAAPAPA